MSARLAKLVSRRGLLVGGSGSLLLSAWVLGRSQAYDDELVRAIVREFRLNLDAIGLGQKYLERFPHENSAAEIVEKLRQSLRRLPEYHDWDPTKEPVPVGFSMEKIDSAIELDFENEMTVSIEGWYLSSTEGRLLALYALTRSSAERIWYSVLKLLKGHQDINPPPKKKV